MNCAFCKIIDGDIPSYTIYNDDILKVFLDINPDSNGHMLVIPKKHVLDITEIDNETFTHIIDISRKMKILLENKLNIDGLTLIQNNGDLQEVKHFHLHLKPYYKDDQELIDVREIYDKLKK